MSRANRRRKKERAKNGMVINLNLVDWKKATEFCKEQFGDDYDRIVQDFVNGIKTLQSDAEKKYGGNPKIEAVVMLCQVNSIDDLNEKSGAKIEYSKEEWNSLWKAAGYELLKGTKKAILKDE